MARLVYLMSWIYIIGHLIFWFILGEIYSIVVINHGPMKGLDTWSVIWFMIIFVLIGMIWLLAYGYLFRPWKVLVGSKS